MNAGGRKHISKTKANGFAVIVDDSDDEDNNDPSYYTRPNISTHNYYAPLDMGPPALVRAKPNFSRRPPGLMPIVGKPTPSHFSDPAASLSLKRHSAYGLMSVGDMSVGSSRFGSHNESQQNPRINHQSGIGTVPGLTKGWHRFGSTNNAAAEASSSKTQINSEFLKNACANAWCPPKQDKVSVCLLSFYMYL